MTCTNCGHYSTRVLDSRHAPGRVRRRRECVRCRERITTVEIVAGSVSEVVTRIEVSTSGEIKVSSTVTP